MFGFGACSSKRQGGFGSAGFAAPPWAHKAQEHGCGGVATIMRDLNVTDEQLEKIAELKLEAMAACAQMKVAAGQTIRQIANELTKDQIDKAKVKDLAKQIKEQKLVMGDAMLDRMVSFAETLTPEQRKKLKLAAIKRFLDLDGPEE